MQPWCFVGGVDSQQRPRREFCSLPKCCKSVRSIKSIDFYINARNLFVFCHSWAVRHQLVVHYRPGSGCWCPFDPHLHRPLHPPIQAAQIQDLVRPHEGALQLRRANDEQQLRARIQHCASGRPAVHWPGADGDERSPSAQQSRLHPPRAIQQHTEPHPRPGDLPPRREVPPGPGRRSFRQGILTHLITDSCFLFITAVFSLSCRGEGFVVKQH